MKLFETAPAVAGGVPAAVELDWSQLAAGPLLGEVLFSQDPQACTLAIDAGLTEAGVPLDEGTQLEGGGISYQHDKVVTIAPIGPGKRGLWAHRNTQWTPSQVLDERRFTERSLDASGTELLETSLSVGTDRFNHCSTEVKIQSPTGSVQFTDDGTPSLTLNMSTRFAYACAGKTRHALQHPSQARLDREVSNLLRENQTSRQYNLHTETGRTAFLAECERRLMEESRRTFAADMAVVFTLGAAVLHDAGLSHELIIDGLSPTPTAPSSTFSVEHNADNTHYGAIRTLLPQIFHLGMGLQFENVDELTKGTAAVPVVTLQTPFTHTIRIRSKAETGALPVLDIRYDPESRKIGIRQNLPLSEVTTEAQNFSTSLLGWTQRFLCEAYEARNRAWGNPEGAGNPYAAFSAAARLARLQSKTLDFPITSLTDDATLVASRKQLTYPQECVIVKLPSGQIVLRTIDAPKALDSLSASIYLRSHIVVRPGHGQNALTLNPQFTYERAHLRRVPTPLHREDETVLAQGKLIYAQDGKVYFQDERSDRDVQGGYDAAVIAAKAATLAQLRAIFPGTQVVAATSMVLQNGDVKIFPVTTPG